MRLTTTTVDGLDLQIAPSNFRADPVDWSSVGNGIHGRVHFDWPVGATVRLLTFYYEELTREQALRLVSAVAPRTTHNKVLSFDTAGPLYSVPGAIRVSARVQGGIWSVQIDAHSRELGI